MFVLNFPINFPWFEFDYSFNTSFNHFNFRSKEYYQFHKQPNYTVGFLHVLCFLLQIPDCILIRSFLSTQGAPFSEYQMQFSTWKSGAQHRSAASVVLHHSGEELKRFSWHWVYNTLCCLIHLILWLPKNSKIIMMTQNLNTRARWERLAPGVRRTSAQKRVPSLVSSPTRLQEIELKVIIRNFISCDAHKITLYFKSLIWTLSKLPSQQIKSGAEKNLIFSANDTLK